MSIFIFHNFQLICPDLYSYNLFSSEFSECILKYLTILCNLQVIFLFSLEYFAEFPGAALRYLNHVENFVRKEYSTSIGWKGRPRSGGNLTNGSHRENSLTKTCTILSNSKYGN